AVLRGTRGLREELVPARDAEALAQRGAELPRLIGRAERGEAAPELHARLEAHREILRALDALAVAQQHEVVLDHLVAQVWPGQRALDGKLGRRRASRLELVAVGLMGEAGGVAVCPAADQAARPAGEGFGGLLAMAILADDVARAVDRIKAIEARDRGAAGAARVERVERARHGE